MTEWILVKKKRTPRKKQSEDDLTYSTRVAKDVERLLRESDTTWTPEQLKEALEYPTLMDIWYVLDTRLGAVVEKRGKRKYYIKPDASQR